jgi:kynureninase
MHQNVSIAQSVVLSCFDWSGPRNKIVGDALNFPSNEYLYRAIRGAELIMVEADEQAIVDAIDDRTQLVSVSHVAFRTSALLDLRPIIEKAHRVGAMVVADIYQSAGCVPLDVRALGVDFAVGGSVKWLCGGPGNGYLYVRRDLWPKLSPAATGWQAHARPFEFETGAIEYANSIYKFLNGTPNVPAMYAGMSGYEIVGEIGVEAIRDKSIWQTQRLIELAEAAGFRSVGPRDPSKRGGTVVIDVSGGKQVVKELARRDILCDYRPGAGVRLAPHFYTKDEELETAVAAITEVRESLAR